MRDNDNLDDRPTESDVPTQYAHPAPLDLRGAFSVGMRDFEANVGHLFEHHGLVPVRRGWPDYAIFRRDGTLKMLVEVKGPDDTVSFQQHLIHDALRAAGIDVRVVHLEDIPALIDELNGHPVDQNKSQPSEKPYCTQPSCQDVLRHRRHRIIDPADPIDAEIVAFLDARGL